MEESIKLTICRNRSEFIVNFHFRLKIVDKPHEKNILGFIVPSRVSVHTCFIPIQFSKTSVQTLTTKKKDIEREQDEEGRRLKRDLKNY
jgi:hypothetical protein